MKDKKIVRTRFAPSPTGDLHIGSLRTALFSWLYARKHQGQFILRIEDTDLERSTTQSVDAILQGMEWAALNYDEGPYFQTKRFDRYYAVIQQLIEQGRAYYCDCSVERLAQLRQTQSDNKQKPRYDGLCRERKLKPGPGRVVRFLNPDNGEVVIHDQVYGEIRIANSELDDLVIARADGSPTYNFTVVVDDWDMQITHVIRGDDHINNTPRQINILIALGAQVPVYAHLPMILGQDGKRLSKRHGATSVLAFRDAGYLPQAMLNYLARLGWAHGDQEIFSIDELIQLFDLDHVHKAPAAFDINKLQWLNQHYLKTLPPPTIVPHFKPMLQKLNLDLTQVPQLEKLITAHAERSKTLVEMAEKSRFFFEDVIYDEAAVSKHITAEIKPVLKILLENFEATNDWQATTLHNVLHQVAEQQQLGLGKIAQPLRVAVTGGTVSPSIDITLELLGKTKVCERLQRFIAV